VKNVSLKKLYGEQAAFFPLLYAFLLPFGKGLAIIMIIWFAAMVLSGSFLDTCRNIPRHRGYLLVLLFFILHVISALMSDHQEEAGFSVEVKLCFFAFPVLLSGPRMKDRQVVNVLIAFIAGCLLASVICIIRAFVLWFSRGEDYFYYNRFSFLLHPSYFSMYLVMATVAVIIWYPQWFRRTPRLRLWMFPLLAILPLTVFLCASKMGLITFAIFVPVTVVYILLKKRYYKLVGGFLLAALLALVVSYKFLPEPFERMERAFAVSSSTKTIDKTSSESTAVRILIWTEAMDLIRQHPVLGSGVADANEDLYVRYQQQGMTGAYEHRLNAHNQYLQTAIGLGYIGAVVLVLLIVGPLILGLIRKNVMLSLFSLLILLNFLVESMLQTQAGNLFYVFFLCLFLQYDFNKLDADVVDDDATTVPANNP